MKRIMITISSIIIGFSIFLLLAHKEIDRQLKNVFLSNGVIVVDNFKRECVLETYNITEDIKYIKLIDLDYVISDDDIDLENSYIAFYEKNNQYIIYLTLIGIGKYKDFSYINKLTSELTTESITNNKLTLEENVKSINASIYEEE